MSVLALFGDKRKQRERARRTTASSSGQGADIDVSSVHFRLVAPPVYSHTLHQYEWEDFERRYTGPAKGFAIVAKRNISAGLLVPYSGEYLKTDDGRDGTYMWEIGTTDAIDGSPALPPCNRRRNACPMSYVNEASANSPEEHINCIALSTAHGRPPSLPHSYPYLKRAHALVWYLVCNDVAEGEELLTYYGPQYDRGGGDYKVKTNRPGNFAQKISVAGMTAAAQAFLSQEKVQPSIQSFQDALEDLVPDQREIPKSDERLRVGMRVAEVQSGGTLMIKELKNKNEVKAFSRRLAAYYAPGRPPAEGTWLILPDVEDDWNSLYYDSLREILSEHRVQPEERVPAKNDLIAACFPIEPQRAEWYKWYVGNVLTVTSENIVAKFPDENDRHIYLLEDRLQDPDDVLLVEPRNSNVKFKWFLLKPQAPAAARPIVKRTKPAAASVEKKETSVEQVLPDGIAELADRVKHEANEALMAHMVKSNLSNGVSSTQEGPQRWNLKWDTILEGKPSRDYSAQDIQLELSESLIKDMKAKDIEVSFLCVRLRRSSRSGKSEKFNYRVTPTFYFKLQDGKGVFFGEKHEKGHVVKSLNDIRSIKKKD